MGTRASKPSPIWLLSLGAVLAFFGVQAGQHWGFTVDDAGISFAYARNLASGDGLVLTRGAERVEAVTNLLWCVVLAPATWLHVPHALLAKLLGLVSAAGALVAIAFFPSVAYRRAPRFSDLVAPLLAGAMPHFALWAVSGLENGFFSLLTTCALLALAWEENEPRRFPWSSLLVSLAFLTRPDGAMYVAVIFGAKLARALFVKRRRTDLTWVLVVLSVVFVVEAFRLAYFAWPMPNSFYAKKRVFSFGQSLLDWKNGRGWAYVKGWVEEYRLLPALEIVPLMLLGARAPVARLALVGYLVAGFFLPLYSNGDWMEEYRFLTFVVPALALAIAEGARSAARLIALPTRFVRALPWTSLRRPVALAAAVVAFGFVLGRGMRYWPDRNRAIAHDTVSIETVTSRAHYYLAATTALGLPPFPTVLDPDVGGLSYDGRLRVVDLFGLGDLPLSRTHPRDPSGSREAIFWERRPTFIHLHGAWIHDMELERLEEVELGYLRLPPSIGVESEPATNYVRRASLAAPWTLPQASWAPAASKGAAADGATISHAVADPKQHVWIELSIARAATSAPPAIVIAREGAACCELERAPVVAGGVIPASTFLAGERPRARLDVQLPVGRYRVGLREKSGDVADIGALVVEPGGGKRDDAELVRDMRALVASDDLGGAERLARRVELRLELDGRDRGAQEAAHVLATELAARALVLAKGGAYRTAAILARRAEALSDARDVTSEAADVAARVDGASRDAIGRDATLGVELAREAVLVDPRRSWSRRRVEEHRAAAFLPYDGGRDQIAYRFAAAALAGDADLDRAIVFLGSVERWVEAAELAERAQHAPADARAKVVVARGLASQGRAREARDLVQSLPCADAHDPELTRALAAYFGRAYRGEPACSAPAPARPAPFDVAEGSFESGAFGGWTLQGAAFGGAPANAPAPNEQFVNGYDGARYASSYVAGTDLGRGRLRSRTFRIQDEGLSFLVGGGKDVRVVGVRLLVDGKRVREAAGQDTEALHRVFWDLRPFQGHDAHIEIYDESDGGWGHVLADDFRVEPVLPPT